MKTKNVIGSVLVSSGLLALAANDAMAAKSPVLDGQAVSSVCVNKRTGQMRIIDQLKKNTCRKAEVTYHGMSKVKDKNGQLLGYTGIGANDPYSVGIYVPALKANVGIVRSVDTNSPDGQSLTQGDINRQTNRTIYYAGANCVGQEFTDSGWLNDIVKTPDTGIYVQFTGELAAVSYLSRRQQHWDTQQGWVGNCVDFGGQAERGVLLPNTPTTLTIPFTTPVALPVTFE